VVEDVWIAIRDGIEIGRTSIKKQITKDMARLSREK
jgi:hypothetical protein